MSIREANLIWSRKIRIFHWINVVSILLLIVIGVLILNAKSIGITNEGKVLLKTWHVYVGYLFSINLLIRIVVGFIGKQQEKWSNTLPFTKNFVTELRQSHKKNKVYKGHSPVGKLMVGCLLLFMSVQMITGLVLAGTDLYYPPFGDYFAKSIAIDKADLESIKRLEKDNVDKNAYTEMRTFRKPFITAHYYSFYILIMLIPLHILGVILAEKREGSALVSAMITGYKYLPTKTKEKNTND